MKKRYTFAIDNDDIHHKIRLNYGCGRLFRETKDKCAFHGETLILAHILRAYCEENKPVSQDTLNRVLRKDVKEKILTNTRQWLHKIREGKERVAL